MAIHLNIPSKAFEMQIALTVPFSSQDRFKTQLHLIHPSETAHIRNNIQESLKKPLNFDVLIYNNGLFMASGVQRESNFFLLMSGILSAVIINFTNFLRAHEKIHLHLKEKKFFNKSI